MAGVVGGEVEGRAVGRPGGALRPAVELGGERPLLAGRDVDEDQAHPVRLVRAPERRADGRHRSPVGRHRRRVVPGVARREDPGLAGREVEDDEVLENVGERREVVAGRDEERPVGRQAHSRVLEREGLDVGLEVARGRQRRLGIGRNGRCQKVPAAGREPVIPVADRVVVLEEKRAHAGVLASLAPLGVSGQLGGAGEQPRSEGHDGCVPGGRDPVHAAVRRDEEARLAAVGRQQPERVDLRVRVRFRVWIGPARGEEQRAVGQELGPARLAGRRAGDATGCRHARRVHLPERRAHPLAFRIGPADGDDEAPAVRRETEAGEARQVEEALEIELEVGCGHRWLGPRLARGGGRPEQGRFVDGQARAARASRTQPRKRRVRAAISVRSPEATSSAG